MLIQFLITVHSLRINVPLIFTEKDDTNYQLTASDKKTLRLEKNLSKDSKNGDNIAYIEPEKNETYKVRFGSSRYMYKKRDDPGVVAIELEDDIAKKYGNLGFIWKISSKDDVYVFENEGKCLTKVSKVSGKDSFYLNGRPCKKDKKSQEFKVNDAFTNQNSANENFAKFDPMVAGENVEKENTINLNIFMHHNRGRHHSRGHHRIKEIDMEEIPIEF